MKGFTDYHEGFELGRVSLSSLLGTVSNASRPETAVNSWAPGFARMWSRALYKVLFNSYMKHFEHTSRAGLASCMRGR